MGAGDLFCRCQESELERLLHNLVEHLQSKGLGQNIVKDDYQQLSPPEYATWTGKTRQMALCRNGRSVWLEVREFRKNPAGGNPLRIDYINTADREDFASTVGVFCSQDGV